MTDVETLVLGGVRYMYVCMYVYRVSLGPMKSENSDVLLMETIMGDMVE